MWRPVLELLSAAAALALLWLAAWSCLGCPAADILAWVGMAAVGVAYFVAGR